MGAILLALLCGARFLLAQGTGVSGAASGGSQNTAQDNAWMAAPPTSTGIEVGTKIPAFSIPDQNGKTQTFESIRGPKGAAIYFMRSADW
jgi:hypothetical protein